VTVPNATVRAGRLAIWAALAACLSTSFGGSSFVAIRFLVTETDPVTIAFLRNAGAALVLTPIAFALVRRWPNPRELLIIGVMGAVLLGEPVTASMIIGFVLIIVGIATTNWPQRGTSVWGQMS
jgi:drug/metabolite transporter (DMT)-like permease